MTKYFTVLEHLCVLGQLPWEGQVKVLVIKNSSLLVMIVKDWGLEDVVEQEGDILFLASQLLLVWRNLK